MDNIKDNNSNNSFNDPISWKSLGFFSAEDYLVYIFKKTEKITAALYLVSGLLKDDEPLKWELRDRGMDLLSSSFTVSSSVPGDKNIVIQSLFNAALETISLLNVAKFSNLISDMNHSILVREIDRVISLMRDRLAQNAENAGYILSEAFFKTQNLFGSGLKVNDALKPSDDLSALQNKNVLNNQGDSFGQKKYGNKAEKQEKELLLKGQRDSEQKKNKRQESILNILEQQSNLTIKDFSKVIKDCSEKTIQRELLDLVARGVVKREGERRWSRYSIK